MNILVLGNGAREHSICWSLTKSRKCKKIYCSPGNGGIEEIASCVYIDIKKKDQVLKFCKNYKINLVIIGPEEYLEDGLVDYLLSKGINTFGPKKTAAKLETSKSFAKKFLRKNEIPTAAYNEFNSSSKAHEFIKKAKFPIVIKVDGLAAGKGVIICESLSEAENSINLIMKKKKFGDAGKKIIIEEFLKGFEISYFAFFDKNSFLTLGYALDHKKAKDNDKGPNTGGMGSFSPSKKIKLSLKKKIEKQIIKKTWQGLKEKKIEYNGILFFGLMISDNKPYVIEYNVRFGDPECQTLLMNLKSDLLEIILATTQNNLKNKKIYNYKKSTVSVVLASNGYPESYKKNILIENLEKIKETKDLKIFHAGTIKKQNQFYTNGGRILSITVSDKDISASRKRAYNVLKKLNWPGGFFRKDIGIKNY